MSGQLPLSVRETLRAARATVLSSCSPAMVDEAERWMSANADKSEALIVRPGDSLIVRYSRSVTMEQAVEIKRQLVGKLPLLNDVLVLTADEIAVYRP